jgi:WD40 repeat protein
MLHFRSYILFPLLLGASFLTWADVASAQPKAKVDAFGDPLPAGAVARLGSTRLRPGMWVTHLAFSPDGKRLASWSDAGFSLWDAATGRELRRVERFEMRAFAFRWLMDGRGLAVVEVADDNLFVWDFTDPKAAPPPDPQLVSGLASDGKDTERYDAFTISPDGKHLAAGRHGSQKKARQIDLFELVPAQRVQDLKRVRTLGPHPGDCLAVAFTPDGRSLLAFTQEHKGKDEWLLVYDPVTGEELRRMPVPASTPERGPALGIPGSAGRNGARIPETGKVFAVAPDGRTVALGPSGGEVILWDVALGKRKVPSPTPKLKWFEAVAFAENGRALITAGYDSPIRVWDVASGRKFHELGRESGGVTAIAVAPDGQRAAVGGENGGIRIWDVAAGVDVCPVPGHRARLRKAVAASNGRDAVTSGEDNILRFWNLADGRERHCVEADGYYLFDPHFTPDGKAVLAGGKTGLRLWDTSNAKPLPVPGELAKYTGQPRDFSADGRTMLTSAEGIVALWDWPDGRLRREILLPHNEGSPTGKVFCSGATLSSDGRLIATIRSEPGGKFAPILEVWEAASGRRLHQPIRSELRHSWTRFAPDSSSFLEVDSAPNFGWRFVEKGAKPAPLPGLIFWDAVRLQRRPNFLAPASQLQRNTGPVAKVALSPDGRTLATALDGRAITLFEVATGKVRRQLPAGHRGDVTSLTFTADGRWLISASRDQTALVWDVSLAAGKTAPAAAWTAAEKDKLWGTLTSAEAGPAYDAMTRLAADADAAVALVRGRLKPAASPEDAVFGRLLADLDSPAFAARTRATAELDRWGDAVVPGVLARWRVTEALESRRRLEQFLDKHDRGVPSAERLRELRALELLEQIGSAEARALLRELAGGVSTVRLTRDAAAALRRLEGRKP